MSQEATIRRGVRNARYAAIPNHVFEDVRLSMEARWLLSYLLSKPDNWTVVIGDIIKKGMCGRDKARKMIAELVEIGYAEREQIRADGKFGASVLVIYDEPNAAEPAVSVDVSPDCGGSVAFLPQPEMPSPVKPSPVKSAHSNNLNLAKTESLPTREESACQGSGSEVVSVAPAEMGRADRKKIETEFTLWFATWNKGDIEFARNAWFALSADERAECIERTPAYLRTVKLADRAAAAVYLKNRQWRDLPEHVANPPEKTMGIAKVCGKLWMGRWFEGLSKEPTGRITITSFESSLIEAGDLDREKLVAEKLKEHGWPAVKRMRDLARAKEPFVTSLDLLPLVADFRQVHRDDDLFNAWVRLHAARGWPFIDHPAEWVWMPAVDAADGNHDAQVEAALGRFISTIKEGRTDDAA